ncbi:MAG: protein-glutamate O-methyltransferase [Phycisphaerales bacterium]|nr:protein-glutamate O-methyltransferase [Phycisphaerales bacterium]
MTTVGERELSPAEYELFRALVYEKSGINLGDQKQQLVRARLGKRLRAGGFDSYRDYYEFVARDSSGDELCLLIDAISTNTTHLFREKQHFDFVARTVRGWLDDRRWRQDNDTLRVWSAGCSSGEESYSLAMTLDDVLGRTLAWKLLATDISTKVLARAKAGKYEAHRLGTVPPVFRQRYFAPTAERDPGLAQIVPALRERITFTRLNLMDPTFPFRRGFHFIFCRNVMIYFDRPTQEGLVQRFVRHLRPGGYLMIGHSESLNGLNHGLRYVQPTVYQRGRD